MTTDATLDQRPVGRPKGTEVFNPYRGKSLVRVMFEGAEHETVSALGAPAQAVERVAAHYRAMARLGALPVGTWKLVAGAGERRVEEVIEVQQV